ncbi:uncharacterized protein LOC143919682 [Arctopsyche grandis]|uniref:uncharacterized protein LOC143919682 n=1 Tax=Arctopsyche grandis TaxID=121162 RepID=UPI00406D7746
MIWTVISSGIVGNSGDKIQFDNLFVILMECRLCLCSAPAGSFVSIHDDLHPRRLVQRILACCQLRVRKGDMLPDTICLSCVNNLELLNSFRNACHRSAETSRLKSDECLKIEPEEVLLDDLIWQNESKANLPPNISSSPDEDETRGGKIISEDNMTEIINTIDIPVEELPLRKALDKMCSTHSVLEDKIKFQDKPLTPKHLHVTQNTSRTRRELHKCSICSKAFESKRNFNRHMCIHTGIKPHKCEICLKSFITKPGLMRHVKIHSGEKPFKCDMCLKSFILKQSLMTHVKIHSGENRVKCDICSKSYISKPVLRIHMKIHFGEKPFKCNICLKSFASQFYLSTHMTIHSGVKLHKCHICLKSLMSKSNLMNHIKIHSGEKPFKCDICLKAFIAKCNLMNHVKLHSAEKRVKCDICLKSYISKHVLMRHMKIHWKNTVQV